MCNWIKRKNKCKDEREELMYVFNKYQQLVTYFDGTDEANQAIFELQRKHPHATLGWIYDKIIFDKRVKLANHQSALPQYQH